MKKYATIYYQLTRPISYLFLKHEDGKIYNWIVPLFLMTISIVILYFACGLENVIRENGLIAELSGFISSLPGFLIASLAAIATFNRPIIDQEMINAPVIDIKVGNTELKDEPLTRRDFLLRLFAFLTVDSIFLILYSKIGLLGTVPNFFTSNFHIAEWIFISGFFLIFWQIIVLLLFAMYYLCERLNLNL